MRIDERPIETIKATSHNSLPELISFKMIHVHVVEHVCFCVFYLGYVRPLLFITRGISSHPNKTQSNEASVGAVTAL